MPMRSTKLSKWLPLAALLCCSSCQSVPSSFENKTGQNDSRPRVFSPRMDYDEWTPLGRGDPLKNNPTFDYVPPVLDRVQYWLGSHTTEPSSKRDILVLGVTAKKTSPKIPEQFLKFVDGPKFTRPSQLDVPYRNDFTGSSGAEPPKVMRTTSFRNGLIDYRNQNRLQSLPASYYPSPYYSQKMKPYTMMMPPPPMIQKVIETSTGASKDRVIGYGDASQQYGTQTEEGPVLRDTQYYVVPSKDYGHYYSPAPSSRPPYSTAGPQSNKGVAQVSQVVETVESVHDTPTASRSGTRSRYEATTTAPSVSFEKSNLIYHSTQTLSGGWLGNNGPTSSSSSSSSSSTTGFSDANRATWQTPDYSRDRYEVDHRAAASSNREVVVVGQNANIIVDGSGGGNENVEEEAMVVGGRKELGSSTEAATTTFSTSESVAQTSTVSTTQTAEPTERGEEETVTGAQSSVQKMHIIVANSPASVVNLETHQAKKGPVAVVMPTNYADRNFTSSPWSEAPTTLQNDAWENDPATSEMTTRQTPKSPAVMNHAATNSFPTTEGPSVTFAPNKMAAPPSQHSHHQHSHHPPSAPLMLPSRQQVVGGGPPFVAPQGGMISQSATSSQARPNHAMMHFIGSMRPGSFRPSSPMSMPHMSPPMAHIHVPPARNSMAPSSSAEQAHQRPQLPVAFTGPPSTTSLQTIDEQSIDRRRPSRLPATTVDNYVTTTTVSSIAEYASTATVDVDGRTSARPDQPPLAKILNAEETRATLASSSSPPRTTTVPSLTTDPIFSHYKQPTKPIRGPMYLIIQGHSKVKTYKPTMNKHGVPVEINEIAESATERQLSKLEQLIRENTKNGDPAGLDTAAEKRKLQEKARAEKLASSRQDSLMSLVESGLMSFTVSPASTAVTEDERSVNSVTGVEID